MSGEAAKKWATKKNNCSDALKKTPKNVTTKLEGGGV